MAPKGTLAINATKYQIIIKKKKKEKLKIKPLYFLYGNRFSRRKLDELLLFTLELVRITERG